MKFSFVPAIHNERSHFCLLRQQYVRNESMQQSHFEAHLTAKHSAYVYLHYHKSSKEMSEKGQQLGAFLLHKLLLSLVLLRLVRKFLYSLLIQKEILQ